MWTARPSVLTKTQVQQEETTRGVIWWTPGPLWASRRQRCSICPESGSTEAFSSRSPPQVRFWGNCSFIHSTFSQPPSCLVLQESPPPCWASEPSAWAQGADTCWTSRPVSSSVTPSFSLSASPVSCRGRAKDNKYGCVDPWSSVSNLTVFYSESDDRFLGRTQLFVKTEPVPKGVMCQVQPVEGAELHTPFSIFCTSGKAVPPHFNQQVYIVQDT